MHKSDYELIAHAIAVAKHTFNNEGMDEYKASFVVDRIEQILAVFLGVDNSRFDRDKFLEAASKNPPNYLNSEGVFEGKRN